MTMVGVDVTGWLQRLPVLCTKLSYQWMRKADVAQQVLAQTDRWFGVGVRAEEAQWAGPGLYLGARASRWIADETLGSDGRLQTTVVNPALVLLIVLALWHVAGAVQRDGARRAGLEGIFVGAVVAATAVALAQAVDVIDESLSSAQHWLMQP